MPVQSLGQEDTPGEGNGNPLQYFCLGNPKDGGVYRVTVDLATKPSPNIWKHYSCSQKLRLSWWISRCPESKCTWPFKGKAVKKKKKNTREISCVDCSHWVEWPGGVHWEEAPVVRLALQLSNKNWQQVRAEKYPRSHLVLSFHSERTESPGIGKDSHSQWGTQLRTKTQMFLLLNLIIHWKSPFQNYFCCQNKEPNETVEGILAL